MPMELQSRLQRLRAAAEIEDYERHPSRSEDELETYLMKNFTGKRVKIDMPIIKGGHGGGDNRLRDVIFRNASVPEYMRLPDARAGAMSVLTGVAARTSIEKRRPVKIEDLVAL